MHMNKKNIYEYKFVKENKLRKGGNYSSALWPSVCAEMVWQKSVTIISTYHGDKMREKQSEGKKKWKPLSVLDYYQIMIAVDLKYQLIHAYQHEREKDD
jgi:hypothetical protein